jgi:hypothetical protein
MASHARLAGNEAHSRKLVEWLSGSAASLAKRFAVWMDTCADYWAAAALYEEMRGLSDTELRRRGLSRDALAHHACRACDRSAGI